MTLETGQWAGVTLEREGTTPEQRGSTSDMNCEDVFTTSAGGCAVIGEDRTDQYSPDELAAMGIVLGPEQRLVALTPAVLAHATVDMLGKDAAAAQAHESIQEETVDFAPTIFHRIVFDILTRWYYARRPTGRGLSIDGPLPGVGDSSLPTDRSLVEPLDWNPSILSDRV